jgi:hypothetical protein
MTELGGTLHPLAKNTPVSFSSVVDTEAQVTLVSEEFYKSLDPAPPIRKEVVMNTTGKGIQIPKHYPIGQLEHRYCSVFFLIRNTLP